MTKVITQEMLAALNGQRRTIQEWDASEWERITSQQGVSVASLADAADVLTAAKRAGLNPDVIENTVTSRAADVVARIDHTRASSTIALLRAEAERDAAREELAKLQEHHNRYKDAARQFMHAAIEYADDNNACDEFEGAAQPLVDLDPDMPTREIEVTVTETNRYSVTMSRAAYVAGEYPEYHGEYPYDTETEITAD